MITLFTGANHPASRGPRDKRGSGEPERYDSHFIKDTKLEIRFVTKNPHKADEVKAILGDIDVSIIHSPLTIHEIQTENIEDIVRDKVLKAFNQIGRPVFIEHTSDKIGW
jgi:hypothetical protein